MCRHVSHPSGKFSDAVWLEGRIMAVKFVYPIEVEKLLVCAIGIACIKKLPLCFKFTPEMPACRIMDCSVPIRSSSWLGDCLPPADGNNGVEVIKIHLTGYLSRAFLLNYSKFSIGSGIGSLSMFIIIFRPGNPISVVIVSRDPCRRTAFQQLGSSRR